jgi:anti-sigma factor RsiW
MSDDRSSIANRAVSPSPEEAARESRHEVLRELLGAYADRELPPETVAQIDAHLVGCAECRRSLEVHHALRARLAVEPPAAASPAFRARISAAIDAAPLPAAPRIAANARLAPESRMLWLVASGWVVAMILALVLAVTSGSASRFTPSTRALAAPVHDVPLLGAVVDDYARVSRGDLPGRARDLDAVRAAVSFPVEPLRAQNLRLLAAWTTDVRGEPAAVLAYRLDDRLLVQYLVAEDVFFQHPAIRAAIADHHLLRAADGDRTVVAWPDSSTGTVLVGNVPTESLQSIWRSESTR